MHLEEVSQTFVHQSTRRSDHQFLYWGYLMHGIRTPGGPKTSWIQSPFFRVWAAASLCTIALLLGACHIETQNLDMMKVSRPYPEIRPTTVLSLSRRVCAVLPVRGSSSIGESGGADCSLAGASTVLCIVFPSFVESVKKQGAGYEVLERLHFFGEMNQVRTVFRWIYSVTFVSGAAELPPSPTRSKLIREKIRSGAE